MIELTGFFHFKMTFSDEACGTAESPFEENRIRIFLPLIISLRDNYRKQILGLARLFLKKKKVWHVYAFPTRGSKLITLPICTSICYPHYPPHPQTLEKHPFMPN